MRRLALILWEFVHLVGHGLGARQAWRAATWLVDMDEKGGWHR
jgi:hypothetical protein